LLITFIHSAQTCIQSLDYYQKCFRKVSFARQGCIYLNACSTAYYRSYSEQSMHARCLIFYFIYLKKKIKCWNADLP